MIVPEAPRSEFDIDIFSERYELLSDTFIDMPKVIQSVDKILPAKSTVFEIGLGTGYFAAGLISRGHKVEGIQPRDAMLAKLRKRQSNIVVLAEEPLQSYSFEKDYQVIVSHSSVFLFTRHPTSFGESNEVGELLVFQSFIPEPLAVFENLFKTLAALSVGGRLYINVQGNPLPSVEVGPVGDKLRFEMLDCQYSFATQRVIKHFRATFRSKSVTVEDVRYCLPYAELLHRLSVFGAKVDISRDGMWVTITP